ncbi:MAG: L-2-hydroxyglutarate oxidase [Chthonomonadales bacterium]|nr:L-2-hydroxyglutarate oxidase [Chthonomonadales bacterium]
MLTTDFAVAGAGIVGLQIALELRRRHPDCSVALLEKEPEPGLHASGRNSGVLHAGFYYGADSLKARFTLVGNRRMKEYCAAHGIPVRNSGKLVVARGPADLAGLDELRRRGRANGVPLEEVDERAAREVEPRARTHERALFSPETATVDPARVMAALAEEARAAGVRVLCGCPALGRDAAGRLRTPGGAVDAGFVVNAAGLHADRLARAFGFAPHYRILPFKGLYLHSDEPPGALRTNVYPVPDLAYPFLGVHFTLTVDGHAKIGPTAVPCLWREQYAWLGRPSLRDAAETAPLLLSLLARGGFDFRRLAAEELRKCRRRYVVARAAELLEGVEERHYRRWGTPGIRAQLLDLRTRTLVMDFRLEGDARSMHVLNAVSPAFTCSAPFAVYVCDQIDAAA